jgi:hypothetical protein
MENSTLAQETAPAAGPLRIGWASASITPEQTASLAGQFHMRISEGILDPLTATALALASGGSGGAAPGVVLVSCDLVAIPDALYAAVRARVAAELPELPAGNVILNATHTHTAPEVRTEADMKKTGGGISSIGINLAIPVMSPGEYVEFAAARIAQAVKAAWLARKPGSVGYGLGHAVVGRNRRSCYLGGESRMYGNTAADDFSHIEGYEDHSVNLLGTWDADGKLTGLVVNVPCPSQVSEHLFKSSADYWHDTRVELCRRLGDGLFVLPQCSAAGDQSPHIQWGKAAEERMLVLSGRTRRQEIAVRIADAVSATLPFMEKERRADPVLEHRGEVLELARRRLSEADVAEALAEAEPLRVKYEGMLKELNADPARRLLPRWYVDITAAYRRMAWYRGVALRFEIEKQQPRLPVEAHVVRLGDIVFATNPFEYYLDFGTCIKARSPAVQTFLVQLSGPGTYVPTLRAVAGKSYGAVPASTPVGPEGGREMAEWTVRAIKELWMS